MLRTDSKLIAYLITVQLLYTIQKDFLGILYYNFKSKNFKITLATRDFFANNPLSPINQCYHHHCTRQYQSLKSWKHCCCYSTVLQTFEAVVLQMAKIPRTTHEMFAKKKISWYNRSKTIAVRGASFKKIMTCLLIHLISYVSN